VLIIFVLKFAVFMSFKLDVIFCVPKFVSCPVILSSLSHFYGYKQNEKLLFLNL